MPPGGVDLWWIDLRAFAPCAADLVAALSPDERERAARFHFERDRDRYSTARAIVRSLLGHYLDLPPERLRFVYGAYGKPALDGTPAEARPVSFNVSHSGDLALMAVAERGALGVDLEVRREVEDPEGVAASWMSAPDRAVLAQAPAAERAALFLRCWTRHEAALKAWGLGLGDAAPHAAADGLVMADVPTPTGDFAALATDFAPGALRAFVLDARAWLTGGARRGVLSPPTS